MSRIGGWDEREGDVQNHLNRGALWAITYGDLMSFLAVFFLMMNAMTMMQRQPAAAPAAVPPKPTADEEFAKVRARMEGAFSDRGVQKFARIEVGETRMRITLPEPVLFASGSDALKAGSTDELEPIVDALRDLPNALAIEGHTDDRPLGPRSRFRSNWELSASRAFAVMRFFVERGISPARIAAVGHGEFKPLKPNDTASGRAANRRIEINLVRAKE
ncbi:MAG: OmpA family protein [Elusimicrobia bacterium]|nr:OmpA family protein [Elusimicrobiota bacterium]